MCQFTKRQIYFRCLWFAFLSSIQIIFTNCCCQSLVFFVFVFCFGSFRSTREFITHLETVAGRQIFTYAWHLWPLRSEGSSACHTFCDTGLPFIMVISENPWHSHLMLTVWQWSCHYLFNDLRLLRLEFEHPTFRLHDERSNPLHHRLGV